MRPEVLAEHLAQTIRGLVGPLAQKVAALDAELAAVKADLATRPPLRATGKAWAPHQGFTVGDVTTFDGSLWQCLATHDGQAHFAHEHFRLIVKRGRDGKDAK